MVEKFRCQLKLRQMSAHCLLALAAGPLTLERYCMDIEDHFYYSGIREYGDGFRSLFLCEDCSYIASQAMGWN